MATFADSESLLSYHCRASDVGLGNCEEFQRLLAILKGEALAAPEPEPLQEGDEEEDLHRERDREAALHGRRKGMALQDLPHEQAAEQLISADAMLAACPRLESAKCARVEALIQCARWDTADRACRELLPGVDGLYLRSELLWRQGQLPGAMEALSSALASSTGSGKCQERLAFLAPIAAELQQASLAMDSGDLQACEERCSRALQGIRGCCCSGLRALILTQRASCQLQQGSLQKALEDCCAALAAEPGSPDALHLKYQVYMESHRFVDAFLELQQLRLVAPRYPGLTKLLTKAAQAAAGSRQHSNGCSMRRVIPGSYYEKLGLTMAASAKDIQSAYRRQATKWHPDKWMTADCQAQEAAAEQFHALQEARSVLADPTERARYDARISSRS
ncbi:hypothetical protein CVIRNUC_002413 [Coccomyxa viridis]|uniref:J domain-containing protein n=1 Tax=Coccomyxa viridis TaxID=1274662 RepID=A0AAV1HX80_9CHLO|nr:hypothetical protein CVIRNUC_002413 [Coccomyxa viridis]